MAPGASGLVDAFRRPEFNVAAFVRDATGQGQDRLARLTQQLEDASNAVDEELQREVVACHEELLQSTGSVGELDVQLGGVREVVESLRTSTARVRGDILEPFHGLRRRAVLLERMQSVNVLIRKLLRFLFDARKLRTQMEAPTKDYSKAAHTLHELETVLAEGHLERVEVLRAEAAWIRETGARVRRQAEEELRSGVRQSNQLSLSSALQVFFNLHCLWPQLRRMLEELLEEFSKAALPMGAGFQQALDVNLQVLVNQTQRVHLVDEVVRSKTDPLTHRSFSSAVAEEGVESLTGYFWGEVTSAFKTKIAKVSQDRTSRKALLADFPKVLSALSDAMDRVSVSGRSKARVLSSSDREAFLASVSDLRNEFLGESIRRLTEPVEIMLPEKLLASLSASGERVGAGGLGGEASTDDLPTPHDLKRYAQLLAAELERCECCPELLLKEAVRQARSSVLLLATRLEQVIDSSCLGVRCFEDETELKLRSPLPQPAPGHARNARIFGVAHHALTALREAVPARFQAVVVTPQVQSTFQQIQAAIVEPVMGALRRAAQAGLSSMEAGVERTEDGSPRLIAVGQACAHVSRYYFALFGAGQLLPYLKELCVFLVHAFLASAALVKPCDEKARAAMAQDMQVVETALAALDTEFQAHIRHEACVFREFRRLLFSATETADFDELANVLPLPLLLTYLVHQLPAKVPSLPAFKGVAPGEFMAETLLPLCMEEKPEALCAFKALVADLCDRHGLEAERPMEAFIIARSA